MTAASSGFSVAAVYAALDEQRTARGLSWAQVTREINAQFSELPSKPISASTVTGLRDKPMVEGDGVLQMLLWLGRAPESFVPGHPLATAGASKLPHVARDRILRFDTKAIHAALDAKRTERGMTWQQVAREIGGVSPAVLTGLAKGGRTGFPHVMWIVGWIGRPVASFTRSSEW